MAFLTEHKDEIEEALAWDFSDFLGENLEFGRIALAALKPATIKKKGHAIPLVETKDMIAHIGVKKNRVGMLDGTHKPSGLSYDEIASVHEYGRLDKGIPSRPAWRIAKMKYEASGRPEKVIERVFKKYVTL